MSFRMSLKIQYGDMKRSFYYEIPEVYQSDYEQAVAHTLTEFRDMLTQIMPGGFSNEATEGNF